MLNNEQESCNGSNELNEDKLSPMPELIDDIKNTKSHIAMSNKKKRRVRIAASQSYTSTRRLLSALIMAIINYTCNT